MSKLDILFPKEGEVATIDKETALKLVEKCKKQKRPRVYCITSYLNKKNNRKCYAICYNEREFGRHFRSRTVCGLQILWGSDKFNVRHPYAYDGVYDIVGEWSRSELGGGRQVGGQSKEERDYCPTCRMIYGSSHYHCVGCGLSVEGMPGNEHTCKPKKKKVNKKKYRKNVTK